MNILLLCDPKDTFWSPLHSKCPKWENIPSRRCWTGGKVEGRKTKRTWEKKKIFKSREYQLWTQPVHASVLVNVIERYSFYWHRPTDNEMFYPSIYPNVWCCIYLLTFETWWWYSKSGPLWPFVDTAENIDLLIWPNEKVF